MTSNDIRLRNKRSVPELTPNWWRIVEAVAVGNTPTTAAAAFGVDAETFQDWLERGSTQKVGRYCDFYRQMQKAKALAEMADVAALRQNHHDSWQVAVNRLERRNPWEWARRTPKPEGPVRIIVEYAEEPPGEYVPPPQQIEEGG